MLFPPIIITIIQVNKMICVPLESSISPRGVKGHPLDLGDPPSSWSRARLEWCVFLLALSSYGEVDACKQGSSGLLGARQRAEGKAGTTLTQELEQANLATLKPLSSQLLIHLALVL